LGEEVPKDKKEVSVLVVSGILDADAAGSVEREEIVALG
jgi:hypothetical protein